MIVTFPSPYDAVPRTTNGITFDINNDGDYVITGTATAYAYERLYYTRNSLPAWFQFDKDIEFRITTTGTGSSSVYLAVYGYTTTGSTRLLQTRTDAVLNVPSSAGYVGLMIRLMVNVNASVNAVSTVKVVIPETFVPRTSKTDPTNMIGSPYYTGQLAGYYALPNCTRYAYGRWWEIMGQQPTGLANKDNAEDWWNGVTAYQKGQQPALGAIICFADGIFSGWGHVAVVEKIYDNGDLLISNSGYPKRYFYMTCVNASDNYRKGRRGYEGYAIAKYRFLGFIYLPDEYAPGPTPPPDPSPTQGMKPLWFYIKRKPF